MIREAGCEFPERLLGDQLRLRQVLLSLVGNAIKFTQTGEVVFGVEVAESQPGEVTLKFSVRDTGIGIKNLAQKRIFNAFEQEDGSSTRRFGLRAHFSRTERPSVIWPP